jgi:hypothetical protein
MQFARRFLIVSTMLLAGTAFAADKPAPAVAPPTKASPTDAIADSIFYQEARLVENMHKFTPLVETYIQNIRKDDDGADRPTGDSYFLGRLVLDKRGINDVQYDKKKQGRIARVLDRLDSFYKMKYLPQGFMQLVFLSDAFDKDHYDLKYQRQEFLGQVRTLVFDVTPKKKAKGARFLGRIWVEDKDHNIVRINGTYTPQRAGSYYFHFDSWRLNMQPGLWLPAYVYTEDSDVKYDLVRHISMRGQTRLWGYDKKHSGQQTDYTDIQVDQAKDVTDQSGDGANEVSPIESERKWQREAEDNVLNIEPEVRCRVLLTTPLESFTVGHTIVLSRGLLDVLPDEASLATILSHELAHIALGHPVNTKYAFSDRMIFPDEQVFQRIAMQRNETDEEAADKKAIAMLQNSPYKDKLATAGLFLRALDEHSHDLTWLINPNFGNKMASRSEVLRMASLEQSAPQLKKDDLKQLAALPLGSRVKLDPWDDHISLQKSKPPAIMSARDKMPFEVTPVFPNLVRSNEAAPAEVAQKQ